MSPSNHLFLLIQKSVVAVVVFTHFTALCVTSPLISYMEWVFGVVTKVICDCDNCCNSCVIDKWYPTVTLDFWGTHGIRKNRVWLVA